MQGRAYFWILITARPWTPEPSTLGGPRNNLMRASTLWRLNVVLLGLHGAGAALAWFYLPSRVPIHFGFRGNPDAWASTSVLSWFSLVAMSCGLSWFIHALTMHGPVELWNIPEKQRFLRLSSEQQAPILDQLRAFGALTAICATVVLLALHVGVYLTAQNPSNGLPWYVHLVMLGSLAVLLVMTIPFSRAVRRAIRRAAAAE